MQVEATALQRLWRSRSLGSCISASVVVSSPSSTRRHCSCISDVTSKLSYGQRLQHFSLRRSNQRLRKKAPLKKLRSVPSILLPDAYLLFCEDRQTFQCWPSYRKIGEAVGLSPNTIHKHIRSLEERGLLIAEPTMVTTKDGKTRSGNLRFTIRLIQFALQQDYDQQMQKLEEDAARRRYADFIENAG